MVQTEIKAFDLAESTIENALKLLKPHLPTSIPLYRRLQFGRFFESTRLLTNLKLDHNESLTEPWLIAYVDRSCRPETEIWLFASWETQSLGPPDKSGQIDTLVSNLMESVKALGAPFSIHQDVLDAQAREQEHQQHDKDRVGLSRNDYIAHMTDPNIMLLGAIHQTSFSVFQRLGLLPDQFKAAGVPNHTFIFDIDSLAPKKPLPQGLRYGNLDMEHFALVRSRTSIPRQEKTLAALPQAAIFTNTNKGQDQPIAWAFMGLDGSLTSLHVEQEWRGKGLAKAVTKKLFNESYAPFRVPGVPNYAHGYVIEGNKESEGMCRSLGGKSDWQVYWMRVDLSRVG